MSEESEGQDNAGNEGGDTGGEQPSYFLSEGVSGSGDKPEWFKDSKYKTVSDQAKAYKDLEGKFGSFSGAPDAYSVNAPEGFEIPSDGPLMESAQAWAKEQNMNQEGFDSLVGMHAEIEAAKDKAFEDYAAEQISQIDNYEARQENMSDYLKANDMESLAGLITNKDQMEQFEKLLDKAGNATLDPNSEASTTPSQEDIDKLMFEKDEHGRQIYNYDRERQARVRKMIEAKVGKGSYRQVIG